jgi:hypothetical protein
MPSTVSSVSTCPLEEGRLVGRYGFECGHCVGWFRWSVAERHALYFLGMCQLDLVRVSELRSIEIFRTPETIQQVMSPGTGLI